MTFPNSPSTVAPFSEWYKSWGSAVPRVRALRLCCHRVRRGLARRLGAHRVGLLLLLLWGCHPPVVERALKACSHDAAHSYHRAHHTSELPAAGVDESRQRRLLVVGHNSVAEAGLNLRIAAHGAQRLQED